jgi:hypothetical protein
MDRFKSISSNSIMKFDGNNYVAWSNKMHTYLMDIGVDVWLSVENGCKPSKTPATDPEEKKASIYNYKSRNNILQALPLTIQSKVICCNSTKEVWDKLKKIYEGDDKVKQIKLQIHRAKFENLKMEESENIVAYPLRIDEVDNSITGLGEEVNESIIV